MGVEIAEKGIYGNIEHLTMLNNTEIHIKLQAQSLCSFMLTYVPLHIYFAQNIFNKIALPDALNCLKF